MITGKFNKPHHPLLGARHIVIAQEGYMIHHPVTHNEANKDKWAKQEFYISVQTLQKRCRADKDKWAKPELYTIVQAFLWEKDAVWEGIALSKSISQGKNWKLIKV